MINRSIKMLKNTLFSVLICGFAGVSCLANAEGIATLTATCSGCHGPQGIAIDKQFPNLAGQTRNYLAAQIRAFRDGERSELSLIHI